MEASWERGVEYLASHAGRWVPGWELADVVYSGACSRNAVENMIRRARRHFRIESSPYGYRIGRRDASEAKCPDCGGLRVWYPNER